MRFAPFLKSEYIYSPKTLFHRLKLFFFPVKGEYSIHKTVLGFKIKIRNRDVVGKSILHFGLYDLVIVETILRLIKKECICIDGGANFGFYTMVMATRNKAGRIHSFEPNPIVSRELEYNVNVLNDFSQVTCHKNALSDRSTDLFFKVNEENYGESKVVSAGEDHNFVVQAVKLEDIFVTGERIRLFKLDIEGYEFEALSGAKKLLSEGLIDHIIFEDHNTYPSNVARFLESYGYTIYKLGRRFRKPELLDSASHSPQKSYHAPNFLATLFPEEVNQLMGKRGWKTYGE